MALQESNFFSILCQCCDPPVLLDRDWGLKYFSGAYRPDYFGNNLFQAHPVFGTVTCARYDKVECNATYNSTFRREQTEEVGCLNDDDVLITNPVTYDRNNDTFTSSLSYSEEFVDPANMGRLDSPELYNRTNSGYTGGRPFNLSYTSTQTNIKKGRYFDGECFYIATTYTDTITTNIVGNSGTRTRTRIYSQEGQDDGGVSYTAQASFKVYGIAESEALGLAAPSKVTVQTNSRRLSLTLITYDRVIDIAPPAGEGGASAPTSISSPSNLDLLDSYTKTISFTPTSMTSEESGSEPEEVGNGSGFGLFTSKNGTSDISLTRITQNKFQACYTTTPNSPFNLDFTFGINTNNQGNIIDLGAYTLNLNDFSTSGRAYSPVLDVAVPNESCLEFDRFLYDLPPATSDPINPDRF